MNALTKQAEVVRKRLEEARIKIVEQKREEERLRAEARMAAEEAARQVRTPQQIHKAEKGAGVRTPKDKGEQTQLQLRLPRPLQSPMNLPHAKPRAMALLQARVPGNHVSPTGDM